MNAPLYRRSHFSLAASKIFSFSLAHNSLTMHRYGALCIYATWGLLRFLDELLLKYIFGHYFFKWFFCVCCPNHGCNLGLTEPLSPLTCLSSRLSLQSIRPRAGLLPTTLNWVSPLSPLQRSCWSSQPAPAKQNLATNKAPKGHGRSPRPKVTDSHCSPQSSAVSSAQTLLRLLYASGVFPECWNRWFFGSILSCFIAVFLGKGSDNLSSFTARSCPPSLLYFETNTHTYWETESENCQRWRGRLWRRELILPLYLLLYTPNCPNVI